MTIYSMSIVNATAVVLLLLSIHSRQPGCSQWHASAVTFFESWQIWLQYFCLSVVMQLQAGCAHFFVPAMPVLLILRNLASTNTGADGCSDALTYGLGFPKHDIFLRKELT